PTSPRGRIRPSCGDPSWHPDAPPSRNRRNGGAGAALEAPATRPGSGRQRRTTLTTAGRDDAAPGAGAHAQTESVHLGTTTVVRLEGPLALGHGWLLT